jgi:hypothetical protein
MNRNVADRFIPGWNVGWTIKTFWEFKELVEPGAQWDFKITESFTEEGYPSGDCDNSVTLCGMCVHLDTIGNIHYGAMGFYAGIRPWVLHQAAGVPAKGSEDDPEDVVAIDIGIELVRSGRSLCDLVWENHEGLGRGTDDKFKKCVPSMVGYDE